MSSSFTLRIDNSRQGMIRGILLSSEAIHQIKDHIFLYLMRPIIEGSPVYL